jgi:predicted metal-dependent hydrolase
MGSRLKIGEISVDVVRKNIKHAYLRVLPPAGEVRLSVPRRMSSQALRAFVLSKLDWIERQQAKIQRQVRPVPPRYLDRESLHVWGVSTTLRVTEHSAPPSVELKNGYLHLQVRFGTDGPKRQALIEAWYREQIQIAIPLLLAQWEPRIGVKVKKVSLRRMKTRWGSCSAKPRTIRLNTELAKMPRACLEYVLVHELAHLLEPSHNARFKVLMDRFLPGWRATRRALHAHLPNPAR